MFYTFRPYNIPYCQWDKKQTETTALFVNEITTITPSKALLNIFHPTVRLTFRKRLDLYSKLDGFRSFDSRFQEPEVTGSPQSRFR